MGTSLAQQLRNLAVPQSALGIEGKRKASLLFDPKEAATFDRDVFYDLGISGLEDLKKLNPEFAQFEKTLFDLSSKNLQRIVETSDVNAKLDQEITKFLCLLSPYFLLNSSHKALEWLIQRFQIHKFNIDQLLMLILPYHSTNTFVRVLQLIKINDPNHRWNWLHPLKKAGVPLAQKTLLNHCASSNWFMSFVCQIPIWHLKICGEWSRSLHTLTTFCCTTIVGRLMHSEISEVHVTTILKLLIETLLSPFIEFSCMSVIITAQLVKSTKLSEDFLKVLVNKLSKNPHESLQTECSAVVALVYHNQQETMKNIPEKALFNFAKSVMFIPSLKKIMDDGGQVNNLLVALVNNSTQTILKQQNEVILEKFLDLLIATIKFNENTADRIILIAIQSYINREITEYSDENMDVDDNCESTLQPILQWYSNFVRNLEVQYPTVFDSVVKTTLETVQVDGTRKNLLELLGFFPKMNFQISIMDMWEKLHHPSIAMRVEGVNLLISKLDILKEEGKEFVQNAMRTILQEDNHKIIEAVLKCPVSSLASVVGEEYFVMQMIKIASKYWHTSKVSNDLKNKVLSYLCSDVSSNETAVWFAILPYLLPKTNEDIKLTECIIKSEICCKNKFILAVNKEFAEQGIVSVELLCSVVMKIMTREEVVPSVSDLLDLVNEIPLFKTEAVYKFLTCILLTTASIKENVGVKWKVLDIIKEYYTSCKITYDVNSSLSSFETIQACMKATYKKKLPIAGMLHCLLSFANSIQLPETVTCQHWWHISSEDKNTRNSSMLFYIRIFESLVSGCMDNRSAPLTLSKRYIEGLKNLFKNTFQNLEAQLGFLSNLWVLHEVQENYPGLNYELQLRSLLLARSLLKKTEESVAWTVNIKDESIIPLLLVSLSCPLLPIRMAALECLTILKYSLGAQLQGGYHCLVEKLLDHEEELKIDAEQISVVLYKVLSPDPTVMSSMKSSQRHKLVTIERVLFDCVLKDNTPWHIRSSLLKILVFVNSKEILKTLVPLGNKILTSAKSNNCQLDVYQSAVLCNILNRFEPSTCDSLPKDAWNFFEAALLDFKSVVYHERKSTCPSLITMNKLTKEVFEALVDYRQDILRILVHVATEVDSPEVISTVGHIVKKIVLDCKYVVVELEKMKEAHSPNQSPPSAKRGSRNSNVHPSIELIKSTAWREGTSLLELIQNKKKLHNVHMLLPVLFDLLKRCLEFEEQAPVEYYKQLILSCILHTCSKFSSDLSCTEVSGSVLNVELVVQCIRASQNPQTHHHALLVLSQLAEMIPEQVLHNIMAIFTFMGSSILRQDDSYSFQIISKVVDSVIPILVKTNDAGVDPKMLFDPVAAVLRVFVDALVDIPEHRQIPLFYKLIVTLGSDNFLWLLLSLVIESQVKQKAGPDQYKDGMLPKKLEFAVNLSLKFHPSVVIKSSIHLMQYLKSLLVEKEQKDAANTKLQGTANVTKLFDVVNSTKSEYHHFKYAIIIFLSGMIGNPNFIKKVAALNSSEVETMEPLYRLLIECVLQHIQVCVHANESNAGKPAAKFWKCMLGQSYDLLDKVNALLLSDMFLKVVSSLLNNPVYAVSRKAMELMNARLQNEEFFVTCKTADLLSLVSPLMKIISGINEDSNVDQQMNQQTALASMKLLARLMKSNKFFQQVLKRLTFILNDGKIQGNVLASALLCGAELCSCLKPMALGDLPEFVKALLKGLKRERKVENPDVVLLAIVTAVYKVVETFSKFLSPYLEDLLIQVTILSSRLSEEQQTQKITPIVSKLELIKQKIASAVSLRVLVPVVETSHFYLLSKKKYGAIGPLMVVLSGSFSGVTSADFNQLSSKISSFFLAALQFRCDNGNKCQPEVIDVVEGHVVKALVALVLKLSESSFRPLYYNLFHWATAVDVHKERLITFYRVSHNIAECLKGLFILFAGHFIHNAATLLGQINLSKSQSLLYGSDREAEEKSALLLDVLLKTLHAVFLYDSAQFLNKERFDILMQPLVDQLENTLGGMEAYRERTMKLLLPCIVQFAVVTADDTLWKQLNYQILLKTRHSLPAVRLMALETVCGVARKLGDDFLPQLPETVPFLAELMEDEEEEVEAACVKVVQELEEVLGEPLKKYF